MSVILLVGVEANRHTIKCGTTAGDLEIELDDVLSPLGVARLLDLVSADFFNEQANKSPALFRAIKPRREKSMRSLNLDPRSPRP